MRISVPTSCLLFACLCVPLHSNAQSQSSPYTVSVRQLQIPDKAIRAYNQGIECLAKKEAEASLVHFQRAISDFPGFYEAYDRIGAADLKLWRIPNAEQAFRKSVELSEGQYAHPLLALGAILDDQHKYAEAEEVTRKGLALEADSWTGHYYLAVALFGLNRLDEAADSALESLREKPDFPQPFMLLADIHGRERNYLAYVSDLDAYLKLAPDGPASARARAFRESARRMLLESQNTSVLAQSQP
jgi:tetratricopeptide (TPR) repeat protein